MSRADSHLMVKDGKHLYSRAAIKVVDALIDAGHFGEGFDYDPEDIAFAYSTAQHALDALLTAAPATTKEAR